MEKMLVLLREENTSCKVNLVRREIPKLVRCTLEALIVAWL